MTKKLSERLESGAASGVGELTVVETIVAASETYPIELFVLIWQFLDPGVDLHPRVIAKAIEGDLTSAEQLHNVVLPGYYLIVNQFNDGWEVSLVGGGRAIGSTSNKSFARAWVTAIVKVKEEELG